MNKKWLSILLGTLMVGTSLAGCSQGGSDSAEPPASGDDGTAGTQAAVNFDEEPTKPPFMYWAANDARDLASVQEAFNELTMEQLNMKVNLMPITFGTYTQQIQMVLSSDDKLDIFPFWASNMGSYIDSDYIIDLGEYMDTYGQDMVDIIGMDDIMCCSIDGFIGGVPTMHERTNPCNHCPSDRSPGRSRIYGRRH